MCIIVTAIITMTGRVTMRDISRWTGKGGSYRTVQRFFQTAIPWPQVFWRFFREHCLDSNEVYILVGMKVWCPNQTNKRMDWIIFLQSV